MTANFLKTEFILFISRNARVSYTTVSIRVGSKTVLPVKCVRNLGAFFDAHLSMESHINEVSKSAHYNICRIRSIHKFLTREAAESCSRFHYFKTGHKQCPSLQTG